MKCRHCKKQLSQSFIDLGFAPPSNAYVSQEGLSRPESYYPLRIKVCNNCWLVQTEDFASEKDFFSDDYAYFSSTSKGWLEHAKKYCQFIVEKLKLNSNSLVVEIASNDGYLLRNFKEIKIPCLGIEPTLSTAVEAEKLGIRVIKEFFGSQMVLAGVLKGEKADLIIGNNVYAHVPDINDFTMGLKLLLAENGTITLEFPHLMQLIVHSQFDTIYHEHFSYLSLYTVRRIFENAGLKIYDVEELETHGGSLRVYGCHIESQIKVSERVNELLRQENKLGLQSKESYDNFQSLADSIKDNLLSFLIEQKRIGKTVVAYGAAAKGNTILNYAGIKPDLISFVYDAAKAKQDMFMPGSHIPILPPEKISLHQPDFILILPWNIASEVKKQLSHLRTEGVRFVTAVPNLEID